MKNYLQAALLASAFIFVQSNAVMNVSPEDMHTILGALKGKTFEQPKEMVKAWIDFKAQGLSYGSAGMTDFAQQFKDENARKAWDTVADSMKRLADDLKSLPVPDQKLMKDFKSIGMWINHKSDKLRLKAEQMRIIANQLSDEKAKELILKKASQAEEVAASMRNSMQQASQ